jgi:hypothetical protein
MANMPLFTNIKKSIVFMFIQIKKMKYLRIQHLVTLKDMNGPLKLPMENGKLKTIS